MRQICESALRQAQHHCAPAAVRRHTSKSLALPWGKGMATGSHTITHSGASRKCLHAARRVFQHHVQK